MASMTWPTMTLACPWGLVTTRPNFAVASIRRWWQRLGSQALWFSQAALLITADGGGSNGPPPRLWLWELQRFADEIGMILEISHYPPGTSKWNRIEHRLFCHITRNWQRVPLETLEIVVKLISSTKTNKGLEVHAWLDGRKYEKKDAKSPTLNSRRSTSKRNTFHGDWNYEIHLRP